MREETFDLRKATKLAKLDEDWEAIIGTQIEDRREWVEFEDEVDEACNDCNRKEMKSLGLKMLPAMIITNHRKVYRIFLSKVYYDLILKLSDDPLELLLAIYTEIANFGDRARLDCGVTKANPVFVYGDYAYRVRTKRKRFEEPKEFEDKDWDEDDEEDEVEEEDEEDYIWRSASDSVKEAAKLRSLDWRRLKVINGEVTDPTQTEQAHEECRKISARIDEDPDQHTMKQNDVNTKPVYRLYEWDGEGLKKVLVTTNSIEHTALLLGNVGKIDGIYLLSRKGKSWYVYMDGLFKPIDNTGEYGDEYNLFVVVKDRITRGVGIYAKKQ